MSLARLWQGQGKKEAALELLAPVYNWFTARPGKPFSANGIF